jgi:hypothetical protein
MNQSCSWLCIIALLTSGTDKATLRKAIAQKKRKPLTAASKKEQCPQFCISLYGWIRYVHFTVSLQTNKYRDVYEDRADSGASRRWESARRSERAGLCSCVLACVGVGWEGEHLLACSFPQGWPRTDLDEREHHNMVEVCGGLEMNGGFRKSAFCIATSTLENAMATFTV